jgi:hypothetical protein
MSVRNWKHMPKPPMNYLLLVAKLDKDVKNDIRDQHNSLQIVKCNIHIASYSSSNERMHEVDDPTTSNMKLFFRIRKPY